MTRSARRSFPRIRVSCTNPACDEVLFRWPGELGKHRPVCSDDCRRECQRAGLIPVRGGTRPIRDHNGRRWCGLCHEWHPISERRWYARHQCTDGRAQLQRERRAVERMRRAA